MDLISTKTHGSKMGSHNSDEQDLETKTVAARQEFYGNLEHLFQNFYLPPVYEKIFSYLSVAELKDLCRNCEAARPAVLDYVFRTPAVFKEASEVYYKERWLSGMGPRKVRGLPVVSRERSLSELAQKCFHMMSIKIDKDGLAVFFNSVLVLSNSELTALREVQLDGIPYQHCAEVTLSQRHVIVEYLGIVYMFMPIFIIDRRSASLICRVPDYLSLIHI